MKKAFPCLLIITLLFLLACHKAKGPAPDKKTNPIDSAAIVKPNQPVQPSIQEKDAAIKGMVLPLFALNDIVITVTNKTTTKDTLVKPDAQGNYKFDKLTAGEYEMKFLIGPEQKPAFVIPITLIAGEIKDIGRTNLTGSPLIPLLAGTGSITGSINPAAVSSSISATHVEHRQTYTTTVDADGKFLFDKLPPGRYTCAVSANGYTPVTSRGFDVDLAGGQSLQVGEMRFYNNADPLSPYFITYEIDGVKNYRKYYAGASYASPEMRLYTYNTGIGKNSFDEYESYQTDRLDIMLDEVTGPGTYAIKGTAKSAIKLSTRDQSLMWGLSRTLKIWSVSPTDGSGTVTITSIDPATRTMSGTFTATLVPNNTSATGKKVITNGAFANFKY